VRPLRLFVSSVQKEFAAERRAPRDYVHADSLRRRFFDVFLFEDVPAADRRADDLYLDEVRRCDVYVGLFGNEYGFEDGEGVGFVLTVPRRQEAGIESVAPLLTPPVAALLRLLSATGPLGNAEIREHFELKDRTHVREHYVDPALAAGMIELTVPEKPTSRIQKYRLTANGREAALGLDLPKGGV
jgi:hypothetical protein